VGQPRATAYVHTPGKPGVEVIDLGSPFPALASETPAMAYLPELHRCAVCGVGLGPDSGDGICAGCDADPDALPELTPAERAAMDSLPADFAGRVLRGERPVTDPDTFAN
jgi:hypothetical protein